jgi:hypothetical protein
MLDCFGADSFMAGRLSAVDGRHGVAMLDSFGADSLVIACLSAVEGRLGVTILDWFGAEPLVIGCLSGVEGRRGVVLLAFFSAESLVAERPMVTSPGFLEAFLVTGRRSLVEGLCDAAEGLFKPLIALPPMMPTILQVAPLWLLSGLAILFITPGLPEQGLWNYSWKIYYS